MFYYFINAVIKPFIAGFIVFLNIFIKAPLLTRIFTKNKC